MRNGRGRSGFIALGLLAAGLLTSGCGRNENRAELEARLAAVHAEGAALQEALVDVEARLHVNRSRTAMFRELGARHKQVSAIACDVADNHMLGMVKHMERMDKKAKQVRWNRRVARAEGEPSGSGGGGSR